MLTRTRTRVVLAVTGAVATGLWTVMETALRRR